MQAYTMKCRVIGYFTVSVTAEDEAEAVQKANTACEEADFGVLAGIDWDYPVVDEIKKLFGCKKPGYEGTYTSAELMDLYDRWADKSEYKDFYDWLFYVVSKDILVRL